MVKRDYYDPGKLYSRRYDDSTGGKVEPIIPRKVDAIIILPFNTSLCKNKAQIKTQSSEKAAKIPVRFENEGCHRFPQICRDPGGPLTSKSGWKIDLKDIVSVQKVPVKE